MSVIHRSWEAVGWRSREIDGTQVEDREVHRVEEAGRGDHGEPDPVPPCRAGNSIRSGIRRSRNIPRRALRDSLRDRPTGSPGERDLLERQSGGARPASRARRASPADQAPQAPSHGQAVPRGDEQGAPPGALDGLHRHPGDACAVAPRSRSAQVDLPPARTG
jgi:hypothetical protein